MKKLIVLLCLILFCGCQGAGKTNTYTRLFDSYEDTENTIGKYAFTRDGSTISINRKDGSEKTPFIEGYDTFVGDEYAYYMDNQKLMRYQLDSGDVSEVTSLPANKNNENDPDSYSVVHAINQTLYITRSSFADWMFDTFTYNIPANELTEQCTGQFVSIEGPTGIAVMDYRSDVSAAKYNLYQLEDTGVTLIKTLADYSLAAEIVGDKIYFNRYPKADSLQKCEICRCDLDGENEEVLTSFSSSGNFGFSLANEFEAESCHVYKDGKEYTYTYATSEFEEIK